MENEHPNDQHWRMVKERIVKSSEQVLEQLKDEKFLMDMVSQRIDRRLREEGGCAELDVLANIWDDYASNILRHAICAHVHAAALRTHALSMRDTEKLEKALREGN